MLFFSVKRASINVCIYILCLLITLTRSPKAELRSMKEMLYEVGCLKSNEDMILALAGQF